MHTFLYQKNKILHTLVLLVFKIVESLQCIFKSTGLQGYQEINYSKVKIIKKLIENMQEKRKQEIEKLVKENNNANSKLKVLGNYSRHKNLQFD